MLAWLFLLLLIVAEIFAVRWWLNREYYPVFFSGWAALYYSIIFCVDCLLAWGVSALSTPGGSIGMQLMALIGGAAVVVTFLMTKFFKWVVAHDMTDIPKSKQ